jgi:hypothetical protein
LRPLYRLQRWEIPTVGALALTPFLPRFPPHSLNLRPAIGKAFGAVLVLIPIRSALLLCAAAASLGMGWLVLRPEAWLVERVTFEGAVRATSAELRHLADLPNGTAMWQVDREELTRAVERHPWVRKASARISWPNTVIVTVEEHIPTAILHEDDHMLYVDEYGEPFLGVLPTDLDYPHLVGFEPELSRLHPELGRVAIRDALWLMSSLDERGLVLRDDLSSISFSRTAGLTVAAGPARLLFGLRDLPDQLDRLAVLTDQGVDLKKPISIDLAPATVALVRPLAPLPPSNPLPIPPLSLR